MERIASNKPFVPFELELESMTHAEFEALLASVYELRECSQPVKDYLEQLESVGPVAYQYIYREGVYDSSMEEVDRTLMLAS